MNGIHDLGGKHGFGIVVRARDEALFHARWERRVFGLTNYLVRTGVLTLDAFRFGIERIDPLVYLSVGYYGRWLRSVERVLTDRGELAPGAVDARIAGHPAPEQPAAKSQSMAARGVTRDVAHARRFAVGDLVRARVAAPAGHTRLPAYVSGRKGVILKLQPACVFPDTHAQGHGENPQHLYNVCFDAVELWGADAETGVTLCLDLFEPYLEAA